jgi:undecaprenyl-diphosphatase
MLDFLESIDHAIVLAINSLHTPLLDEIMWLISGKIIWIPMYLFLIYLAYQHFGKKNTIYFLVLVITAIALSDLVSSKIIKESVERYRPSHNLELESQLHFYKQKNGEFYQGGEYGFVSSHAANFFAIALFVGLIFREKAPQLIYTLFSIAILVGFSRIYLGVHYLSDIIGGAIVGTIISFLLWKFVWFKRVVN